MLRPCSQTFSYHVVGAVYAPTEVYVSSSVRGCYRVIAPPRYSIRRTAPEQFGAQRVRSQMIVGPDGSRFPRSPYRYDTELATSCQVPGHEGAGLECEPPAMSSGLFKDTSCTMPLGRAARRCATPFEFITNDGAFWRRGALTATGPTLFDVSYVDSEQLTCVPFETLESEPVLYTPWWSST